MTHAKRFCIVVVVCLSAIGWAQANPESKGASKPRAAAGAAKSSTRNMEAMVRKAWEAFKAKDKTAYANLLTDDFTAVETDEKGPRDKTAAVAEADTYQINSYTISGFKSTSLGPAAALNTYAVDVDAKVDGKPVRQKMDIAEVWVKRGADWKCVLYQETKRQ